MRWMNRASSIRFASILCEAACAWKVLTLEVSGWERGYSRSSGRVAHSKASVSPMTSTVRRSSRTITQQASTDGARDFTLDRTGCWRRDFCLGLSAGQWIHSVEGFLGAGFEVEEE